MICLGPCLRCKHRSPFQDGSGSIAPEELREFFCKCPGTRPTHYEASPSPSPIPVFCGYYQEHYPTPLYWTIVGTEFVNTP